MRIDDIAYQRATRIAGLGLFLQFAFGLVLLVFGIVAADTTLVTAASYVLIGVIAWLTLVVVFNQHRLERIEALESDELQQQRLAGHGSAFDSNDETFNVAGRRLRLMYKWLLPLASWVIIFLLIGIAAFRIFYINTLTDSANTAEYQERFAFGVVSEGARGWALALCLAMAAVFFICSRFVSGMSKQPAWQNLRGGAGYMVGSALVLLAVAVGIIFTYFNNETVLIYIALAIGYFMILVAIETFANFLLNLYRPRRQGEVPRPAFDSRMLSLLSAPDSIVRSINEAINYQVGFDVTSSWGYRLMMRAVGRLAIFAVVVLVALNCVVVVEPHEQGVVLSGGEISRIEGPGPMFKLPWPFQSAEVYDVTRSRSLPITKQLREDPRRRGEALMWTIEIDQTQGIEPFIVSARRAAATRERSRAEPTVVPGPEDEVATEGQAAALEQVEKNFALIETAFVLQYRIKEDPAEGLQKFLRFGGERYDRRARMNERDRALNALALREVTQYLTEQDLDRILSIDRSQMTLDLERRMQRVFDEFETGVEVLSVTNPFIRPAGEAAVRFEAVAFNRADRAQAEADAQRERIRQLTAAAGSPRAANDIYDAINMIEQLRRDGATEEMIRDHEVKIEQMLLSAGGEAASIIAEAKTHQWTRILSAAARVEEFRGKLASFRAAPNLYREFLLMDTVSRLLSQETKYIVSDSERIRFDIEMKQVDEMNVFDDGLLEGNAGGSN